MGKRIRVASPLDLLPLSTAPSVGLRLGLISQLISSHRPLREMLSAWIPFQEAVSTLLCRGEGGLLACGQAAPRGDVYTWEVRYLAAWEAGMASVHELWEEMLLALGQEAGLHRALRLLASLPDEKHMPPFRRAGFLVYCEEMILRWEGGALAAGELGVAPQPLESKHLWAVQQLYVSLTPPVVQQTEGRRSDSWQLQRGEEGWVWEQEDRVLAHLRRCRGEQGTALSLLLDPAYRHYANMVLAHGLDGAQSPVFLVLRSYQGEWLDVARRLGFQRYAEQILLAKHLVLRAKQPQSLPARTAERPLGTAPSTPSIGRA